ncbi:MAG: ABC transporter substrate-binding protein [Arhodomonas sp.]|nr:ABC transporter substrate-binding protein [Arhodomonas sp.]
MAGPHWGDSEAETRTRFAKAFAEHLLRLYATAVSEYADEVAEFARHGEVDYRTVREANGRAVVRLLLQDRSGRSLSVDLMLHRDNGGWQVYDARVLGISLLRTYRASLRPRLAEIGLTTAQRGAGEAPTP